MSCRECSYFYAEAGEYTMSCHYRKIADWDFAPCEQENES